MGQERIELSSSNFQSDVRPNILLSLTPAVGIEPTHPKGDLNLASWCLTIRPYWQWGTSDLNQDFLAPDQGCYQVTPVPRSMDKGIYTLLLRITTARIVAYALSI